LGAVLLSVALLFLCFVNKDCISGLHLALFPVGLLNLIFIDGYGARYWVPLSLLMTVLLGLALGRIVMRSSGASVKLSALIALVLCANLTWYVVRFEQQPYRTNEPWMELATFFQKVAGSAITSTGVLTPNSHAFQLMTSILAPMTAGHRKPYYEHMVARLDDVSFKAPPQSKPIVTVYPWALDALPRPMSLHELLGMTDNARGILVEKLAEKKPAAGGIK
jgi:hypothetical protein